MAVLFLLCSHVVKLGGWQFMLRRLRSVIESAANVGTAYYGGVFGFWSLWPRLLILGKAFTMLFGCVYRWTKKNRSVIWHITAPYEAEEMGLTGLNLSNFEDEKTQDE